MWEAGAGEVVSGWVGVSGFSLPLSILRFFEGEWWRGREEMGDER